MTRVTLFRYAVGSRADVGRDDGGDEGRDPGREPGREPGCDVGGDEFGERSRLAIPSPDGRRGFRCIQNQTVVAEN